MNDPQRLLDEGATELELMLLRAGDAEGPSPGARRAAAASLGISAAAAVVTSASSAAGMPSLTPVAKGLAVKWWLLVGALGSVAVGIGYASSVAGTAPPSAAASVTSLTVAPAPSARSEDTTVRAPVAPVESSAAPTVSRPVAPAPRPTTSAVVGIQEQIALIDRARSSASAGQPGATLAALDEYQQRFPRGVLQQEATMLRIEALLARGDRANATRLGKSFLAQYPRSAFSPRVKSLIER